MSLYGKFNCVCGDKIDCRAYYLKDGKWQRVGANELNNVENCLSESEVMSERIKLNIPFLDLKTEIETMKYVHLPEWLI